MSIFSVEFSQIVESSAETIWQHWADVSKWPTWDHGIESARLEGDFIVGNQIIMQPTGAPNEITLDIIDVNENTSFTDVADLGFGTITTSHQIEIAENGKLSIKHSVVADIQPEKQKFFGNVVWPGIEAGLSKAVEKLVFNIQNANPKKRPRTDDENKKLGEKRNKTDLARTKPSDDATHIEKKQKTLNLSISSGSSNE